MNTTTGDGNQPPSEVRGDPGGLGGQTADTRDKELSSSQAITQALITALKAFGRYDGDGYPLCYDWCHEYGHKVHTLKCEQARAALAFAEKG